MDRREFLKAGVVGGGLFGGTVFAVSRLVSDGDAPDPDDSQDPTPTNPPAQPSSPTPTEAPAATDAPPPAEDDTPTATAQPVNRADEFGSVVNVVDAGADPNGEEPVNDVLQDHVGDDTLLAFPGGEYRLHPMTVSGYTGLGFTAAYDERPTFTLANGDPAMNGPHVHFDEVSDLLIEGVGFDYLSEGSGGQVRIVAAGDATVRDVDMASVRADDLSLFRVEVLDENASALVEDFRSENTAPNDRLTGIYVGERHAGEVTFRNCDVQNYSDNGLYGSAPGKSDGAGGTVHVETGTFSNNNISNVRLGTQGSSARDVTVVVDAEPDIESVNLRGIRLRRQHEQLVENCDITYTENAGDSFGAIVFHSDNGGATIRDTAITVHKDGLPGIFSFYNGSGFDTSPLVENVTVDGSAAGGYAVEFVGREDVTIRNCEITQTGDDRDGIRIANRDGALIEDCRIEVDRLPIIIDGGTAQIRNTTIVNSNGERTIDEMTVESQAVWPT